MNCQSVWEAWVSDGMHPGGPETTLRLLKAAGLAPGARVADIGCGAGASVAFLLQNGFDAVGVDLSPLLVAAARERHGVRALCADARALPFSDGEMDGLLFECTLSALTGIPSVLGECARVLKKGGALMASDIRYQEAEQAARDWADVLKAAGFDLVHWEDCPGALEAFIGHALWEIEDTALLRRLWETGCPDGKGYFTMVARSGRMEGAETG